MVDEHGVEIAELYEIFYFLLRRRHWPLCNGLDVSLSKLKFSQVTQCWPSIPSHEDRRRKLKLKLFTTCTVCAGLQHLPYAPVAVYGSSQLCHIGNSQVMARPLTT
jgi:hypothetical protein